MHCLLARSCWLIRRGYRCAEHDPKHESWQSAELAQQHSHDFAMGHCGSVPASLLEQELHALQKLSTPPGGPLGADLRPSFSSSLEEMYPGINHTVRGGDYIQRYLQLLCAQEGHSGQNGPLMP